MSAMEKGKLAEKSRRTRIVKRLKDQESKELERFNKRRIEKRLLNRGRQLAILRIISIAECFHKPDMQGIKKQMSRSCGTDV